MFGEREAVGFRVCKNGIRLGDARGTSADDLTRTVPLVLHHSHYRYLYAHLSEHRLCRFFLRPSAVHHDDIRERPLRVTEPSGENLFE